MHTYWNDWFYGWSWLLWFGFIFLVFSSFGNWGYTYRVHRKYGQTGSNALDLLDVRHARGEVTREQYVLLKSDISKAVE